MQAMEPRSDRSNILEKYIRAHKEYIPNLKTKRHIKSWTKWNSAEINLFAVWWLAMWDAKKQKNIKMGTNSATFSQTFRAYEELTDRDERQIY